MSNYSRRKQAEAIKRKEQNKKTIISVAIFVLVVAALVFALWYGDRIRDQKNHATGDPNYDIMEYITLGQYEGLELYHIVPEVTDEDVQAEIDKILASKVEYADITDGRAVGKTDKVTIDFVGTIDGKEFSGGTSKDYTYVLGEGKMIEGFDEGIYGMTVGEERTIDVTFPEDYGKEDLNGKNAQFKITLKKAQKISKQPEWTDAFVKEYSKEAYKTTADYEKYLRNSMLEAATNSSDTQLENDMWDAIFDGCVIDGYPEYLYNSIYLNLRDNIKNNASYYGLTTAQYMQYFCGGLTMHEYVMQYVESSMVTEALIKDMKLELPEGKLMEYAKADYVSYGYKTVDEFIKAYGEKTLTEYYLEQYLSEVLLDSCKLTDVSAEEYEKIKKDETTVKQ